MIVKMQSSDPSRTVSWDEEFGSSADAISQVANIDEMVAGLQLIWFLLQLGKQIRLSVTAVQMGLKLGGDLVMNMTPAVP